MQSILKQTFSLYIHEVILLLIIYQSIIFLVFLIPKRSSKTSLNNSLRLIYLLIIIHFIYILVENNFLNKMLMFGIVFGFIYGPIFNLYTKSLILKKINAKRQILHFLPSGLAFIFVVLCNIFSWRTLVEHEFVYIIIVSACILIYLIASLILLHNYKRLLPQLRSNLDNISLGWLKIIIYLVIAAIILTFLENIISSSKINIEDILITLVFLLILLIVIGLYYMGFRQADIFPGLEEDEIAQINQIKKYDISSEDKEKISLEIDTFIENQQIFKGFELSINDLARELNISPRKISYVINDVYKMNFYDFINSYRIKFARELLISTNSPVKEIMYESGFANKSTFNANFKKHIGLSPSEFRKNKT